MHSHLIYKVDPIVQYNIIVSFITSYILKTLINFYNFRILVEMSRQTQSNMVEQVVNSHNISGILEATQ